jgi:LL-diaminopimelate aminotransferase
VQEANRLKRLPFYLFSILDTLKKRAIEKGMDVIDLGMGNPDLPTPTHIVDTLCAAAKLTENQRYSRPGGDVEQDFKRAIAKWYLKRFKVKLDPDTEVLPLIGSKEGIANLSLSYLNNDDIALVPSPAYPVHFNSVIMAGGILYNIPLSAETGYLPDLKTVPKEVAKMAKLLFMSYPNNPTGAVCDVAFLQSVADWAKGKNIIVGHDLAYSDIVFDGYKAPSLLQIEGAKDFSIEFHTLSKSYNMAGWRVGFAVGNAGILKTLAKTKGYVDFGIFRAIQLAAIEALTGPQDSVQKMVQIYQKRRDALVDGLNDIGWPVEKPKATFYIWARIPHKYSALTSVEFAELLIDEAGVVVSPGTGFGEYGEGYVRFSLVDEVPRVKEAVSRIQKVLEMHV